MVVVINKKHINLNKRLAKEINRLARNFNNKNYSKIDDIGNILLKRDISIERKKNILIKKLHGSIVAAFSVDKKKFNAKTFAMLKKRLHSIRQIIIKLRSINYYVEAVFLKELGISKMKLSNDARLRQQNAIAGDELEALEYTAYKLIEEAAMLDKKLLSEYVHRGEKVLTKEKIEVKDIGLILRKQSALLEHLEAKLPPPKAASFGLMKEPTFTHWVARVFALLSYFEHLYAKEAIIFGQLKKNKKIKIKISKKIMHLIKEKSELLRIMGEKAASMKRFRIGNEAKEEIHNLTSIITV